MDTADPAQVSDDAGQAGAIGDLLFLVVDDLVIGFDDIVRRLGPGRTGLARWSRRLLAARCRTFRGLALRVDRLAKGLAELFLSRLDLVEVVAAERLPSPLDRRVELRLQVGRQLLRPLLRV